MWVYRGTALAANDFYAYKKQTWAISEGSPIYFKVSRIAASAGA